MKFYGKKLAQTLLVAGALMTSAFLNAETKLTAKQILKMSDELRNPTIAFSVQITLIEYNKAKEIDRSVIKVHSKQKKNGGQYRSLVAFIRPERDAGKLMLQNAHEIWFYDPSAKNSVRMSAQQRLMGQASNSDVMTSNFALDYNVNLIGEESIKDAQRKVQWAYRLHMVANTDDVTYASADYWVEKDTSRPVKAKFYSKSKRLMKVVYYTNFQKQLGRVRPTQVLIIDGVDTSKVTRMQMSDYKAIVIPEAWFQRSYLARFKN